MFKVPQTESINEQSIKMMHGFPNYKTDDIGSPLVYHTNTWLNGFSTRRCLSLSLRGRVCGGLRLWIVRRRLAISASWWRMRDSLLAGTCGCVDKLLISRLCDDHCSWVAVTVIRATSTETAREDGSNDGDKNYTADNDACDAFAGDCIAIWSTYGIWTTGLPISTITIIETGICKAKETNEKNETNPFQLHH